MLGITPDWFFENIEYLMAGFGILMLGIGLLARMVDTLKEFLILVAVTAVFVLGATAFSGSTDSARSGLSNTVEFRHDVVVSTFTSVRTCGSNCEPYEHHWTETSIKCGYSGDDYTCKPVSESEERECFSNIEEHWAVTNFGYRIFLGLSLPDNFDSIRVDTSGECQRFGSSDTMAPSNWNTYREGILNNRLYEFPVRLESVNYYAAYLSRGEFELKVDLPEIDFGEYHSNYFVQSAGECGFNDEAKLQAEAGYLSMALSLSGYDVNPIFVWNCDLSSLEEVDEDAVMYYRQSQMPNNAVIFVIHLNPSTRQIVDGSAFTAYPEDDRLDRLFDRNISEVTLLDTKQLFGLPYFKWDPVDSGLGADLTNPSIAWDPYGPVFGAIKEVYSAPDPQDYAQYKDKIPVYWSDVIWPLIGFVIYLFIVGGIHFWMAASIDFE